MKHLFVWKIKDTDKCSFCNEIETLSHAVVHCTIAKNAFKKVGIICTELYIGGAQNEDKLKLDEESILFGISCSVNTNIRLTRDQKANIDKFIILTKQKLILQRENKCYLEYEQIKQMIDEYINIQNIIS